MKAYLLGILFFYAVWLPVGMALIFGAAAIPSFIGYLFLPALLRAIKKAARR